MRYSSFSFAATVGDPPAACTRVCTARTQASAVPVHATTQASGLAASERIAEMAVKGSVSDGQGACARGRGAARTATIGRPGGCHMGQ